MLVATWVDTVRDLGVPAIAGSIVGALIAHFSAKARGVEEHERTLDLLVLQDERRTAQDALRAVRDMKNRINTTTDINYGQLHNEWSDNVLAAARVIRSDDLRERARAGAFVIFLAFQYSDQYVTYVVLRAALDVEEWLEAWLRRDDPPPAHLPTMQGIRDLVNQPNGTVSFDPLNDLLGETADGDAS